MFLMKGFIDPRTHAVTGPASNGTQAGGVAGQLGGGGGGPNRDGLLDRDKKKLKNNNCQQLLTDFKIVESLNISKVKIIFRQIINALTVN